MSDDAKIEGVNKVAQDIERQSGEAVRMDAWRSILERTDRIISGRPVTVKIVPKDAIPNGMAEVAGWSDGEIIHFNGPMVHKTLGGKDALAAVLKLKGLNYHELSHVLYTPRMSDELPKRVVERATQSNDRDWWYAFNALEDQRIETWFTATYSPSKRYFEAMSLEWLVKDGNAEAAILLHGRKYLPARIRVQAGRVFAKKHGQDLLDKFQAVIDEYVSVELPKESIKALTLVKRYYDLLKILQQNGTALPKMPIEDNGAHGHGQPDGNGTQKAGRILVGVVKEGAANAKQAVEAGAKADAKAKAEIAAENGQGEGSGEGGGAGEGENTQEPDESEGGGQGVGGGHHKAEIDDSMTSLPDVIRDMIDEAEVGLEDIAEDEELLADADAMVKAVKAVINNGKMNAKGVAAKARGANPRPEHLAAVRKVAHVLTRIKQDVEPNIERRLPQGRVDIRRFLVRKPTEVDVFTSYDEGAEELTGMEAVLLMDMSGSMSSQMAEASTALWILKRAFDKVGIRTTALVYDTDHEVLFQPSEKAKPTIPIVTARGGTDPQSALEVAQVIFQKSHMPNKVLITVTDGQWGGDTKRRAGLMKTMHRDGVTSMLLTIGGYGGAYKPQNTFHQIKHDINDVRQLPKAALKLVGAIMRRAGV